jgi:DNA-binding MarR family transcriptional regulator
MKRNDLYSEAGVLILGTRLRRLSERLLGEISRVYQEKQIPFEPAWFPVFFILEKEQSITITQLALRLSVSQPAISQTTLNLESRGLVSLNPDPDDKRRRSITLTDEGRSLLQRVRPIWDSLEERLNHALGLGNNSRKLMDALAEFESGLVEENLAENVLKDMEDEVHD